MLNRNVPVEKGEVRRCASTTGLGKVENELKRDYATEGNKDFGGPDVTGFIPNGIYYKMFNIAHENNMSVAQLNFEMLRLVLTEKYGWACDHKIEHQKFSRKIKKWYCKNCYTYLIRTTDKKGKIMVQPIAPVWERKVTMTPEEWSAQIKMEVKDLK